MSIILPPPSVPLTDENGGITSSWYQILVDLSKMTNSSVSGIGYVVSNSTSLFARSFQVGSTKLSITNANGLSGNTTYDIVEANIVISNLSGTISQGQLPNTLAALNIYNTNGFLVQTAANTFNGRTVTGTANQIDVTNGDGVSGNPVIKISATYVGQTSITTLGTITTGTWNGTALDLASYVTGNLSTANLNSGTGATSSTFWRGDGSWSSILSNIYPKVRAYCSTNQSITSGVATKVQLDTKIFDTNTNFDATTNYRFTPTVAGKYRVSITGHITNAAAAYNIQFDIYKNGAVNSSIFANETWTALSRGFSISDLIDMNGSTDYLEMYITQTSGSGKNLLGGSNFTYFTANLEI